MKQAKKFLQLSIFFFVILFSSCDQKELVREFHVEAEPVRLDIRLYSDSSFEERMEEVEGVYNYTGVWSGSTDEDSVFQLLLVDSSGTVPVFINHGTYKINSGEIQNVDFPD